MHSTILGEHDNNDGYDSHDHVSYQAFSRPLDQLNNQTNWDFGQLLQYYMNKKLDNKLLEETSESSEESSMMNGSRFDKVFNKIAKKERKSNNSADLL